MSLWSESVSFATFYVGNAVAVYLVDPAVDFADPGLRADGIIVLDSAAYIHGPLHWTEYMAQILSYIRKATGQRCIAVAQGGLCLVDYSNGKSYEQLLECITSVLVAPKFLLWVVLGNDLYPPKPNMQVYEAVIRRALQQLLVKATAYCAENRFVFGASSEVWQYPMYYCMEACDEYDRVCALMCSYIRSQRPLYPGLGVVTGVAMLQGVPLVDRIGHFSEGGMGQLCVLFRMLVRWGMAGGSIASSRL